MNTRTTSRWNSKLDLTGLNRRDFLKVSAAVAGAGLAAPAVHAQSNTTLRFLSAESSAASVDVLNRAAAEYEDKFGVKVIVDASPIAGTHAKAMAAIKAGVPYDIATYGYIANILEYARGDFIVPLTDLVKKHSWGQKATWQYEGEIWFYPYDYNLVTVYYRKDLYAEKGLKIPETWDQFLENCRALTVSKNGNIDRGGCVIPLVSGGATNWASFGNLFAEGPQFFDEKWNVVLDQGQNADRTARFLDLYAELYKTMPPGMNNVSYAGMMSLFATEKAAHTVYSGRLVEALESTNPDLASKYGIFASPDSSGKQKALSFAFDGFIVFKTKQTEETLKFLEWFTDKYYIDWLHSSWMNFQPARMDVYEDPRWKNHPMIQKHWDTMMQMKSFVEQDGPKLMSVDLTGPSIDLLPCKVFDANIMPEMLQDKVLKNMSSVDCVKTAADKIRALG